MMYLVDSGQVPPGGWKHVEKDGMSFPINGDHRIADLDQLVNEVKKHRQATDGDLGLGWRERFIDELCKNNPAYPCRHEAAYLDRRLHVGDVVRFINTAVAFIDSGGERVSKEVAEARALTCSRCPMNIQNIEGCFGCGAAASAITWLAKGWTTSLDDRLNHCKPCGGCVLKIKVHLPLEVIDLEGINKEDFPQFCWQREVFEQSEAAE